MPPLFICCGVTCVYLALTPSSSAAVPLCQPQRHCRIYSQAVEEQLPRTLPSNTYFSAWMEPTGLHKSDKASIFSSIHWEIASVADDICCTSLEKQQTECLDPCSTITNCTTTYWPECRSGFQTWSTQELVVATAERLSENLRETIRSWKLEITASRLAIALVILSTLFAFVKRRNSTRNHLAVVPSLRPPQSGTRIYVQLDEKTIAKLKRNWYP
eukprot:Gregarina_sp_Poly_1__7898@NODE_449_length_8316_cov_26_811735_g367_i0_p5_GENE_NODE_449_length_8316_cov_26_811735_g367_i0NODE_449_length_8316_cov_26_811735_g367_i0_p5_ORF_typecomplete_len215_score18_69_NODE_449_length_8316_cov_26_811735_g367_i050135657